MGKRVYLDEETNRKTSQKINKTGTVLLLVGLAMIISAIAVIVLALTVWNNPILCVVGGPLIVFGFALMGIGGQAKFIGNIRKINAYMMQQQLPVVKETVEEMTPTIAAAAEELAPAAGITAKEIAKGIKEGLSDGD